MKDMFTQRLRLIGASVATLWLVVGGAWAAPSQEDVDFCNKQAAEVSARTSKGASHGTPSPPVTEQSGGSAADSGQPRTDVGGGSAQPDSKAGMSTTGMAPIGKRDGVYRFAYAVCLHQHGQ